MKIFYTENLTTKTMKSDVLPWDFKPTETLSAQLREDKQTRQMWYQTVTTKHYFYSGFEGANPNMRVSKDNPPKSQHSIPADFDLKIPGERVVEVIKAMRIKPSHIERSLGGNVRLVWTLSRPLPVESFEFASFILAKAVKWLSLDLLPGLDEPAFTDPARLLCNGCSWASTGFGPIPENELQAFFVNCGKEFRFKATDENHIPLDEIEKALRGKYPNFSWPADFTLGTQGPTFWVPDSTSPLSAMVKSDGMFTFSAHASKPFYSWVDLLGSEFTKDFSTNAIAKATADIYYDNKRYWRKIGGIYTSCDRTEMDNFFRVNCKLSNKPGKDGTSPIDQAIGHIYHHGRIAGAAPYLFRRPGVLDFNGKKMLNTFINKVILPASELTPWGPNGGFPWLSKHFDRFFEPREPQLDYFLAWCKVLYESAINYLPMPGQNIFLMGGVNVGKTLTGRSIIGRFAGGFADGCDYLVNGGSFNSELIEVPIWCVDDEMMGESSSSQTKFQAMVKKTAANQTFQYSKKYEVGGTVEWSGRVVCTTNLDYVSSRALGPMDNSNLDKVSIFRCSTLEDLNAFPNRHVLHEIIGKELPYFLRYILEWTPPDYVKRHVRYGYASYHSPDLLEQAHQSNRVTPFKELLFETLASHFKQNPTDLEWRGTITQIMRLLSSNPMNDNIIRSIKLEQTSRYLEMIQRENLISCKVESGAIKTRVWVFPRFDEIPKPPELTAPPTIENSQYEQNS